MSSDCGYEGVRNGCLTCTEYIRKMTDRILLSYKRILYFTHVLAYTIYDMPMLYNYPKKKIFIGIDEVGRGPIAGPVTVGIFVLQRKFFKKVEYQLKGITDSKKLSETKRNQFARTVNEMVKKKFCSVYIISVSATQIEKKGITHAIAMAINRGLKRYMKSDVGSIPHTQVLLDGGLSAPEFYSQETIIKGDSSNWLISTASVLAKVHRDKVMTNYAKKFPNYNFEKNKGYGTREHYMKIKQHKHSPIHRSSWIKK